MSLKTYTALNDQIDVIRVEPEIGGNTKERIAQMYQDIIDSAVVNQGSGVYTLSFPVFSMSGTNTYTASPTPAITAYDDNQKFIAKFVSASTGAVTANLSGIGAKKIFKTPTTQAGNGDIPANQILFLVYDSTLDGAAGGFLIVGGVASAGGGTAADVANVPAGSITAIDVQDAINELDTEKQPALGFTPENVANKAIDFTTLNDTLYPSVQATENRIIAALAGLKWKAPVRVATTVAGTLATSFENGDTIDGVVLATGNRILIKNQATQSENGIYTVNASGAPTRAIDADSAAELEGATVTAQEGTSNPDTTWVQTTDGITLGSSNIVFTQLGTSVPDASETVKGIIEIATQAETNGLTDDLRAITPLKAGVKFANKLETINTQTGDYVLVITDADIKTVVMNVAVTSNTVTIPPNSSVAFPIGTIITIAQQGTGLTSMAAGAGVTIRSSTGGLDSQGQYSPMVIEKIATDEWFLWNGPPPISGAALTRTNDTNVTAVLSGSPSSAVLAAVEIALGWTGQLAVTRGGTGLSASANGDVVIGTGANTMGVVNALATSRTAYWHLKAGTATASTAPLKFTSGTNLTAAENGAVEYDGTNYFVTSGGVRHTLAKILANSATIDFGSVAAQGQVENTITVTGAADGDEVVLGYTNAAANAGLIYSARVSATNTVTVTAYNITASPIDPASATFKVSVIRR